MNGVLKLKWLKSFVKHGNSNLIWYLIPNHIFHKIEGIDSEFEFIGHKNIGIPHNTPIWNSRYILSNRKSLF